MCIKFTLFPSQETIHLHNAQTVHHRVLGLKLFLLLLGVVVNRCRFQHAYFKHGKTICGPEEPEDFINKASFLVNNSQHEVLNL
ncbi:hypothetical protein L1987_70537 [Smallanthus sonchifolius]|uniref:Uncharacterized protein n=1 Tax=Smallanthus sonchifolius TaxID=185202 RepID=A0ACB9AQ75_9ASTR|nr:hypothetical protein L1987_70537 [Smallanthus sonchifolius]